MSGVKELLEDFIWNSKNILCDNLIGIYLHGSLAMGCYNNGNVSGGSRIYPKSDIDLLVVVKDDVSREMKRQYMDMVVALHNKAPSKGIELSIVKETVCRPFVYPTPFELHFSAAHLNWYLSNPEDYIEKMNGTDKDLAAHFTIIYHRGKTLYGKEIKSVFSEVSGEDYMDSIWLDIKNAKEDIIDDTMYITLNLCRVLAYKKERLILSKQEGGEWALHHLSDPQYKKMVCFALEEYKTGNAVSIMQADAVRFAEYMLKNICDE